MTFTLLFRSKSSRLGLDSAPSPPSPSVSAWEEEPETEEEEEEEDEFDQSIQDFDPYNPYSTPFISPGFSKADEREHGGVRGSGQFPILAFAVALLRKSLVTCSVEREEASGLDIGYPTDVKHVCHVTFDRFNGFLGLPVELQPEVPRKVPSASASVFGVSPQSMQCSVDKRGNSVPTILLMMQKRLYQGGGLQAEGIFRINPENTQEQCLRNQLNRGIVPRGIDVHCLAGLIKAWFRELPKGVLDSLTPERVMHCNTEEECAQLVNLLPRTEAALLDWAINLMADVVHHEHYNKMNARNIAMVFAPNMTQTADPLTALIHAVQVMNFLKTLIVRNLRLRDESATKLATVLLSQSCASSPDTITNPHSCISVKDSTFEENQPHGNKLLRSMTLDHSKFSSKKKHRKTQQKYNDDNDDRKHYSSSLSACSSPLMSVLSESGEVESGILNILSLRKGVKKLCRHPILQLSKSAKKTAEPGRCKY